MLMTVVSRKAVFELVDSLTELAEVLELRGGEIERLIAVHCGVWPLSGERLELWWPTEEQAGRIASLCEVFTAIVWIMGPDGRIWMRKHNAGLGCSPMRFMLMGREYVDQLRDILRLEQGRC